MSDAHHKPNHDYHLVDPSIWPLIGALSGGMITVGAVFFFKSIRDGGTWNPWLMIAGFALMLVIMFVWWRDIISEGKDQGHHTPVVQLHFRYGMLLFIASEVMFFVAFFWAQFDFAMFPRSGIWPPESVITFDPFDFPLYNTLLLLLSGTTVTWAHEALSSGDRKNFLLALGITIFLGVLFSYVQWFVEYPHAAFPFGGDTTYGSVFFMATGFHGFHVIIGAIFLIVCWLRGFMGHFRKDAHFGFEAAAWYWHFVDVVWIFLFVAVYLNAFANVT